MPRPILALPPAAVRPAFHLARRGAAVLALALLAACGPLNPAAPPRIDADGVAVRGEYIVTERNITQVRARAEQTLNAARTQAGVPPVVLDPVLVQAADGHSRSMSQQGRAWAFGPDGSSAIVRAQRAGFGGRVLGEAVSETYETEVQAIAEWLRDPAARGILLDPRARRIGLGTFQQETNKLWWTLTVAN